MADDELLASTLLVPDRSLLCGWCEGLVLLFGDRRYNEDGTPHRCRGYQAFTQRQRRPRPRRNAPRP